MPKSKKETSLKKIIKTNKKEQNYKEKKFNQNKAKYKYCKKKFNPHASISTLCLLFDKGAQCNNLKDIWLIDFMDLSN